MPHYSNDSLAIVVIGASGDLAKRKTYPSLFKLFRKGLLPPHTILWGYGRSDLTNQSLRDKLRPFLKTLSKSPWKRSNEEDSSAGVDGFLSICFYHRGDGYDDVSSFHHLHEKMRMSLNNEGNGSRPNANCLFYMAIPPSLFLQATTSIVSAFQSQERHFDPNSSRDGFFWNRFLFEKPFGRDTKSYQELTQSLSKLISETQTFRIDHYLGKAMVRYIPTLRFRLTWSRPLWNRQHVSRVVISMTETSGVEMRGGYYDEYGAIRDILQNHLLQVMALVAMEEPMDGAGAGGGEALRDAKSRVLELVPPPIYPMDCVLGQYEGYYSDPTIRNKESCTPTFATVRLFVQNDRWRGVPFYLVTGKALRERKAEVRISLRSGDFPEKEIIELNELVLNIQPDCEIFMSKVTQETCGNNIKRSKTKRVLRLDNATPTHEDDAYSKLLVDALENNCSAFVRDDELRKSWEILTPLLNQTEHTIPLRYKRGSTGPSEGNQLLEQKGTSHRSKL